MDRLRLRRVLQRFRKEELYAALSEWNCIDVPPNLTKAQVVTHIAEESEASQCYTTITKPCEINTMFCEQYTPVQFSSRVLLIHPSEHRQLTSQNMTSIGWN